MDKLKFKEGSTVKLSDGQVGIFDGYLTGSFNDPFDCRVIVNGITFFHDANDLELIEPETPEELYPLKSPLLIEGIKYNKESTDRKNKPVFSGVLQYFPDAMMEIAAHSKKGNDKHNPGQRLYWDKEKSKDHADCVARHLIDIGPNWDEIDPETQSLHATALAWRALALLQTVLEKKKGE